jgi:hypothetical protein
LLFSGLGENTALQLGQFFVQVLHVKMQRRGIAPNQDPQDKHASRGNKDHQHPAGSTAAAAEGIGFGKTAAHDFFSIPAT